MPATAKRKPETARAGLRATLAAALLCGCAPMPVTPGAVNGALAGDTDGDGLSDYAEIHKYRTDPRRVDSAGAGVPDGGWEQRRDHTYSVSLVMKVLKPADPAHMSDDYQDARVVAEDEISYTVEVISYPLNTNHEAIGENPNFRRDNAGMTEYLRPTPTANWDARMREELVKRLRYAGIDPDVLTDRQLVERVSHWAVHRTRTIKPFSIWFVEYPGGVPTVAPWLRAAFDREKPDPSWTDQRMFAQELLGKEMFHDDVRGACTSSSVYLATILRALGIPTRVALFIPPADPNDLRQVDHLLSRIHHHRTRAAIAHALLGQQGFVDHMFNEVWVGGRWVRLNYDVLGQNTLDPSYLGLMIHVLTAPDVSDVPFASTWGKRLAAGRLAAPKLSSVNPYMLVEASDHFGKHAHVENPEVAPYELRAVTIRETCWAGAPCLPAWISAAGPTPPTTDFLLRIENWLPDQDHHQLRAFERRAGHRFVLRAAGHPDVHAALDGWKVSDGKGTFQAFGVHVDDGDRAKLVAGVEYALEPSNESPVYRWETPHPVVVVKPVRGEP